MPLALCDAAAVRDLDDDLVAVAVALELAVSEGVPVPEAVDDAVVLLDGLNEAVSLAVIVGDDVPLPDALLDAVPDCDCVIETLALADRVEVDESVCEGVAVRVALPLLVELPVKEAEMLPLAVSEPLPVPLAVPVSVAEEDAVPVGVKDPEALLEGVCDGLAPEEIEAVADAVPVEVPLELRLMLTLAVRVAVPEPLPVPVAVPVVLLLVEGALDDETVGVGVVEAEIVADGVTVRLAVSLLLRDTVGVAAAV